MRWYLKCLDCNIQYEVIVMQKCGQETFMKYSNNQYRIFI